MPPMTLPPASRSSGRARAIGLPGEDEDSPLFCCQAAESHSVGARLCRRTEHHVIVAVLANDVATLLPVYSLGLQFQRRMRRSSSRRRQRWSRSGGL